MFNPMPEWESANVWSIQVAGCIASMNQRLSSRMGVLNGGETANFTGMMINLLPISKKETHSRHHVAQGLSVAETPHFG